MATVQPLRGNSNKIFSISANFNQGIDKRTADDVSSDQSFTELVNFYSASEGYLSKRPGVYNSHISDFIKKLATDDYDPTKYILGTNKFGETPEVLKSRIVDLYNTVFTETKKVGNEVDGVKFTFQADKIVGFQLLKNSFFLEAMQDYETILDGDMSEEVRSKTIEFACIMLVGGFYTTIQNDTESSRKPGLYVCRLETRIMYNEAGHYDVDLEIDTVDPTMNPFKDLNNIYHSRWDYKPEGYSEGMEDSTPANTLDISNYNGYSYVATGTNYLLKIDQNPERKVNDANHDGESNIITKIGGYENENIYKPTAIELNQIGFNIMHSDPLTYYDNTGSVAKVKGVFYSISQERNGVSYQQPVSKIPYNKPFYVHIIYTGANTNLQKPKYRPNNGEVDTDKNPYKDLPGDWLDASKNIFSCTGIDSDQSFELFIKDGDDEFRNYFDTTSVQEDNNTGSIKEISELVFSSTHSKVINNQLVLYGGHGYIFFSEYDMFNYFPNYYYLYVASEAGEEAVTGIVYFRQYYAIFTNKRIKRMTGSFGADNFGVYPLSDFIGCPNGRTIRSIGNNLLFLGSDGIYKLKQGYLGEGTENVEKVDDIINGDLSLNNVVQAFVMNNNYVAIKNDGKTWMVYNVSTDAFYEYNLESKDGMVYDGRELDIETTSKTLPFFTIFQTGLYDEHGDFLIVPMYKYTYNDDYSSFNRVGLDIMIFRFSDLDFLKEGEQHKDGYGFTSLLETHYMNMGYPMHTKKFKELFIKTINESGVAIPLYVTIKVDDTTVIDPSGYTIYYNEENDTYYYVEKIESNSKIDVSKVLGEFTLGYDSLGEKTIQQLRFKIRKKGRAIKIRISDGFNDYTNLLTEELGPVKGIPVRNRNDYDFSISSMGIVYKLKKVKEG